MESFILILIFLVSTIGLVKGADWFLESAEKLGLFLGLPSFIVGVTIVSLGTSFPELFTGIMAMMQNAPEIVVANAVGSNIANILLVVGFSALISGKLVVTKSLIDLDIPLLAIGTALLLAVIYPFKGNGNEDAIITGAESILLVIGYVIYFIYIILHDPNDTEKAIKKEHPPRVKRRDHLLNKEEPKKANFKIQDLFLFLTGIFLLAFGSNYLIRSVVAFSELHQIAVGAISIVAVAVGTTLPELFVSIKAAKQGNSELALGNIFGSNIFNSFIVIGVPGLLGNISMDIETYRVGLPFLVISTFLFVISGISKRIHAYEGAFYLLLYILFIVKIFGIL